MVSVLTNNRKTTTLCFPCEPPFFNFFKLKQTIRSRHHPLQVRNSGSTKFKIGTAIYQPSDTFEVTGEPSRVLKAGKDSGVWVKCKDSISGEEEGTLVLSASSVEDFQSERKGSANFVEDVVHLLEPRIFDIPLKAYETGTVYKAAARTEVCGRPCPEVPLCGLEEVLEQLPGIGNYNSVNCGPLENDPDTNEKQAGGGTGAKQGGGAKANQSEVEGAVREAFKEVADHRKHIGSLVMKPFEDGIFEGIVIDHYAASMDTPHLWRIRYSDGDEEDVEAAELAAALALYKGEGIVPFKNAEMGLEALICKESEAARVPVGNIGDAASPSSAKVNETDMTFEPSASYLTAANVTHGEGQCDAANRSYLSGDSRRSKQGQGRVYFRRSVVEFGEKIVGTCGSRRLQLCNATSKEVVVRVSEPRCVRQGQFACAVTCIPVRTVF